MNYKLNYKFFKINIIECLHEIFRSEGFTNGKMFYKRRKENQKTGNFSSMSSVHLFLLRERANRILRMEKKKVMSLSLHSLFYTRLLYKRKSIIGLHMRMAFSLTFFYSFTCGDSINCF